MHMLVALVGMMQWKLRAWKGSSLEVGGLRGDSVAASRASFRAWLTAANVGGRLGSVFGRWLLGRGS